MISKKQFYNLEYGDVIMYKFSDSVHRQIEPVVVIGFQTKISPHQVYCQSRFLKSYLPRLHTLGIAAKSKDICKNCLIVATCKKENHMLECYKI